MGAFDHHPIPYYRTLHFNVGCGSILYVTIYSGSFVFHFQIVEFLSFMRKAIKVCDFAELLMLEPGGSSLTSGVIVLPCPPLIFRAL